MLSLAAPTGSREFLIYSVGVKGVIMTNEEMVKQLNRMMARRQRLRLQGNAPTLQELRGFVDRNEEALRDDLSVKNVMHLLKSDELM